MINKNPDYIKAFNLNPLSLWIYDYVTMKILDLNSIIMKKKRQLGTLKISKRKLQTESAIHSVLYIYQKTNPYHVT